MRPLCSPGFTRRLLSELEISSKFKPEEILYLTPNKRKARAAVFEILSLYKESASKIPESVTLQLLAENLVSLWSSKGIVDERDRRFVFLKLIRESKSLFFREEHVGLLSELYAELCRFYPDDWEQIPKLARDVLYDIDTERRLEEALGLLRRYDAHMEKEGFIDHERLLEESMNYIGNLGEKLLLVEGYFEPRTSEQRLLEALVEKIPEVVVIIPDDPLALKAQNFFVSAGLKVMQAPLASPNPLSCWKRYRSREDEVAAIARHICTLSETGVTPDEIMVVFPALGIYRSLVARVFARYGLKANISLRPALGSFPAIRAAIDILYLPENKFRRRDVVALLLAPFFTKVPKSVRDWVDVLSRDEGIVSGAGSWKSWFLSEPSRKMAIHGEHTAREIRSFVAEFASKAESFSKPMPAEGFTRKLRDILEWLGWDAPPELRKGLEDAFVKLQRVLELTGEKQLTPRFARETLESLLSRDVQLDDEEYSPLGIRVVPVVESRWLDVRYLFLGGLVDGEFPKYPRRDLLLPERIKESISIPSREHSFLDSRFEFRRLELMPREALYLSAPSMEGDRPLLSSVFLVERGESSLAENRTVYSTEEFLLSRPSHGSESRQGVVFENAESLYLLRKKFGSEYPFKVTLLEVYRNCPYRYFLATVLGLEPSEEPSEEPEARLLGNVLHSVMERLMRENPKAQDLEEKLCAGLAFELDRMRLNPFVRLWIEDWLGSRIDWFRQEEEVRQEKGWRIVSEWLERDIRFFFEEGNFTLRGRVDRVDWMGQGARVMDYKTGKETGFAAKLGKGESLQLPLYCEMIRKSANAEIHSFGLYDFNRSEIVQVEEPEDSIQRALAFARDSVEKIREGNFGLPEKKPATCFFCEYKEFCG